ncbi:hypothetical protein [Aquamicrobium sp. LC103]|uniref:hypothetical protein n=1 Tax=Aquamicrobium sp. LC103 TaxID=1120658 RepID=UPI000B2DE582|nr:hypothetical protein [Aquamicrobium sp. LC103]
MILRPAAILALLVLPLAACAASGGPPVRPAAMMEPKADPIPAGIRPLTVEQDDDLRHD